MNLESSIESLSGIGPRYLSLLKRIGIESVGDLLYHFPFRYEDLSTIKKIAELTEGEIVTIRGKIWEIQNIRARTGKFLTRAVVNDGSGSLGMVWFNQPYLTKALKVGQSVSLAGKVSIYNSKLTLVSPDYEIYTTGKHTAAIIPIYPETEGLSSKWIRNKISQTMPLVLENILDPLPIPLKEKYQLSPLTEALKKIHFPKSNSDIKLARDRLGFDEMFIMNLASLIRKSYWQGVRSKPFRFNKAQADKYISSLPFELTNAQKKAAAEILGDLKSSKPMNRLLQGDVGSGKTVVAALAAYIAQLNGQRVLMMAPTSILAEQHFKTLTELLSGFGISVGIRTGSKKSPIETDVVVGTHALIDESFSPSKVGLIVIDEQHRFGVAQRAALRDSGTLPHLLAMTATPIPRTLALSLYSDLDLSVINELPKGRVQVKTYLTPPEKRTAAYGFIREKIKLGQQAFIVTPFIEPSETFSTVRSANEEFGRLGKEVFPELSLGLLHGRMKSKEKNLVLEKFRDKKIDILVATPVVEVGIDIPNATIMVIESAERYGLAALHQLRGRIGRGDLESWCLLFSESHMAESNIRLKYLQTHHSGSELAELDLKLRGTGELYGLRQSGLPEFRIASLQDLDLIKKTKEAAEEYLQQKPTIPESISNQLEPLLAGKVTPD